MIIWKITAIDHYSNLEPILNICYIQAYGSLIENNPFYIRLTLFWLFSSDDHGYWVFHPLGFESPTINIFKDNIIESGWIDI